MKQKFLIVVGCLALLTGCSRTAEQKTDAGAPASLLVINVLDKALHDDAHIKGSINVPFMEVVEYARKINKKTPVVLYCSNYACSASGAAAQQLIEGGFESVWAYEGGMTEWYQLQYPIDGPATKPYLKQPNPKIAEDPAVPVITAQELKKKMEAEKLL